MTNLLLELLLAVVPAVLAITLHEAAHGYAALALGDDTARQMGRLSLNPLRHVDRVGTIILPGILLIGQLLTIGRVGFMFGWAKPVPISPWNFRDPRRGMMLVAAAGPAMNAVLAWLGAIALHGATRVPDLASDPLSQLLLNFVLINLVLGLFNLLPIPPMDGGRIVVGLLPRAAAAQWAKLERVGLLLVIMLLFLGPALGQQLGFRFDPLHDLLDRVVPPVYDAVFRLAGW